jgi:septum formation protein
VAVELLARNKAEAVASRYERGWVLGADTIVVVGQEVLGKPRDPADARRMLGLLSGSQHQVHTGVALLDAASDDGHSAVSTTHISMRPLTPEEIGAYVASGESAGKAGAYAVQENADQFVTRMEGAFDNVVGLPLAVVESLLLRMQGGQGADS